MNTKKRMHNVIILDESGSMEPVKSVIINGINELLQNIQGVENQFPELEHTISFLTFNGGRKEWFHYLSPINSISPIDPKNYYPNDKTPLFDAMGYVLTQIQKSLEGTTDYSVLVTVLTDGKENASRVFRAADIKALVETLSNSGWTFTYIGTDHDIDSSADSLSISNKMNFVKNDMGIKTMFKDEFELRKVFYYRSTMSEEDEKKYFIKDDPIK